jgi:hypothetical protein
VEREFIKAIRFKRGRACIFPDIRPLAAMLPQFEIVDVGLGAALVDKDQLVPGPVKSPHATIVFDQTFRFLSSL